MFVYEEAVNQMNHSIHIINKPKGTILRRTQWILNEEMDRGKLWPFYPYHTQAIQILINEL